MSCSSSFSFHCWCWFLTSSQSTLHHQWRTLADSSGIFSFEDGHSSKLSYSTYNRNKGGFWYVIKVLISLPQVLEDYSILNIQVFPITSSNWILINHKVKFKASYIDLTPSSWIPRNKNCIIINKETPQFQKFNSKSYQLFSFLLSYLKATPDKGLSAVVRSCLK